MPDAIDALLTNAIERATAMRRLPVSTYRLQFHAKFTFRDATKILPYLAALGITHVYASPYLAATIGSTHGYDVIDHCRLNPEVGSTDDYDAFLKGLEDNGLTHILDTVPNHVGVATNDNTWWNDVLEHGVLSRFASYFDITWDSNARPELKDKVLIPTLGKPFGDALDAGELTLSFEAETGRFWVNYFARRFPVAPHTYATILDGVVDDLPAVDATNAESLVQQGESIKRRLAALARSDDVARAGIESAVRAINGGFGDGPARFDRLDALLGAQHFRLADWHVAFDEINYRRFFDVNDLAALSMERQEVFEATHGFILPLLAAGKIAGLRIDHPDGLYDPPQYLKRLQQHFILAVAQTLYDKPDWSTVRGRVLERLQTFDGLDDADRWPLFVSVEKILAMGEPLIGDWATHGTSGYDFLAMLNGLFVDPSAERQFDTLWHEITSDATSYEDLAYQNKRMMLETTLASELHTLTHRLDRLAQSQRRARDFTFRTLQNVLRETIACFGVYRTYVAVTDVTDTDRGHIEKAIATAKQRNPRVLPAAFDYLSDVLLQKCDARQSDEDRHHQQRVAGKFQQLTSPVTAKGIEDTTFYQYNRFLSLNEVGGEPATFGVSPERFQGFLAARQRDWPFALSGSSTHDTKRSEDVRARLNVLSDMPEDWAGCVREWVKVNAALRTQTPTGPAPTPADELLIYQTLLGAWPLDVSKESDFADRIHAYLLKAIREAKLNTRWGEPNDPYEAGVKAFTVALLDPHASPDFHRTFAPLLRKVTAFGLLNSVSQTLLKITSPGVPDIYQGTDLWDFSLVDPDNRRPVDYAARERLLAEIDSASPAALLADMTDGRIKLKVTAAALRLRREHAELFARGDFVPLAATGTMAGHVFGFARAWQGRTVVTAVPLRVATLVGPAGRLPMGEAWGDTTLTLPDAAAWRNVLTGEAISFARADEIFAKFPVALLIAER